MLSGIQTAPSQLTARISTAGIVGALLVYIHASVTRQMNLESHYRSPGVLLRLGLLKLLLLLEPVCRTCHGGVLGVSLRSAFETQRKLSVRYGEDKHNYI